MLNDAKWIKSGENTDEACYEFYTETHLEKPVKSAVLTISAMGMYRAFINDKQIGNEIFTPYWTAYNILNTKAMMLPMWLRKLSCSL